MLRTDGQELHNVLTHLIDRDLEFLSLLDGSPAVGYLKNERGQYVYLNETARRLCAARIGDQPHYAEEDLFQGETLEAIRNQDCTVLSTGNLLTAVLLTSDTANPDVVWLVYKFRMATSTGHKLVAGIHIRDDEWNTISEPLVQQISGKLAA
jgi:hypothetical protein